MIDSSYTTSHPTDPSDLFFGRQAEISWVIGQLGRGQRVLIVCGAPLIGKSSLLRQLDRRLPRGVLPVYLDAGNAEGWEGVSPLLRIAGQVGLRARERVDLRVAPPDAAPFAEHPSTAWQAYLAALSAQLDGQQIVFLIDNAERSAPEWLHALYRSGTALVLAAADRERLAGSLPELGVAPPSITLGALDTEAARTLVKALVAQKAQIDPWAVRRILEVTSRQPHYTVQFCHTLLRCCAHRSMLTPPDVEEALDLILNEPHAEFATAWGSSLPHEQAILSVFAATRGLAGIATQYDVQKLCSRHGRAFPLRDIVATLERLVGRGILERLGANSYRFTLELFRLWVGRRYPPDLVLRGGFRRFTWPEAGAFLSALRQTLDRRWLRGASLAVLAVIVFLIILVPALRSRDGGEASVLSERTLTARASVAPAHTRTPVQAPTHTPPPAPASALPGYDLVMMSREDPESTWQIYVMNTRTGKRLRLTDTDSNERTPRWSPDSSKLIFASDRDGNREIYAMDLLDDNHLANLTQHKAPDWQPAWSPDGGRVAFSSYRDQNWEIYLVHADGTGLERLTEHPQNDFSPTWSPDGRLLFASRRHGDADLFVLDLDTRELSQLTESERDEYDPAWSPDGRWIAFVTQFEDQSDIYVMRADGTDPVNVTHSPYANDFQPTWTADSEELVFVSYTSARGTHDLFRMPRDASRVIPVTEDEKDNLAPSVRDAP
ncbi:MAG: PD40 domain-containing protein [Anaerolineae bacterium]|nr:PD40 domain-containing protein [Anaerolineae bacterium]